jgi:hypothetical protein
MSGGFESERKARCLPPARRATVGPHTVSSPRTPGLIVVEAAGALPRLIREIAIRVSTAGPASTSGASLRRDIR